MSEPQHAQQLVQMIIRSWISRAIYVAAKLRIADHLGAGPVEVDERARQILEAAGLSERCEV